MATKRRITCVVGTRPEAIKMAPVVRKLKEQDWAHCQVICTAQHRELVDQVLQLFGIQSDADFGVMRPNQSLAGLTSRLIENFDSLLSDWQPDALLAQGDTTTAMAAALCSFYRRVPFGHVEAGLRTGNLYGPFPEEMNRLVAARMARWHFAPTQQAARNLIREGIEPHQVLVTGNTVIDALLQVAAQCRDAPVVPSLRMVLVTAHRRENFGAPFLEICRAIRHLAKTRRDLQFLYPVHPNPNVKRVAHQLLGGHPRIRLVEPLDYLQFVAAMKRAHFILTDSGGVQEEAPALGKPVLVLRDETERPEAVGVGVVKLVGTNFERIVGESTRLLDDSVYYASMAHGVSPYGDGQAAERIVARLKQDLGEPDVHEDEEVPIVAVHARTSDVAPITLNASPPA
jgi:UDP-N-acetylglucosamine 2-epimerase (non-hydrolysing)